MSRARRSASAPVSLFPFLAVLVSTMGALVLLLLAINRQVTLQAIAAAVSAVLKQANVEEESLAQRRQELDQDVAAVQGRMNGVLADHQAVEAKLVATDKQIRTDMARAVRLREELAQLTDRRGELRRAVLEIERQVQAIQEAKVQKAEELKNADQTFVPIVHPGASGTTRRPIYLECTAAGIVMQPEEILIPKQVLFAETGATSPLTRAVRSVAQYYLSRDGGQANAQSTPTWEPYPLLLVRPDGIMAYGAARAALDHLEMTFGYELLGEDMRLRFPEADPGARAAVMAAIGGTSVGSTLARLGFGGPGRNRGPEEVGTGGRGDESAGGSQPELGAEPGGGQGLPRTHPVQSGGENDEWEKPPSSTARSDARPSQNAGDKVGRVKKSQLANDSDSAVSRRVGDEATGSATGLALPANPQTGGKIPIPRPIVADCDSSGLWIVSRRKAIAIGEDKSVDLAVEQLLGEVEREVSSWGPPGMTFRWEPRLVCRVHSDGLETFYRLRFALIGSSLEIEHRIVASDDSPIQRTEFLRARETGGREN